MPILLQLQKLPWKGDGGWGGKKEGKKGVCAVFLADQKIASSDVGGEKKKKKAFWGIL